MHMSMCSIALTTASHCDHILRYDQALGGCSRDSASCNIACCHDGVQAAVGSGVEDVREVRQRLVSLETGMIKKQRQEDKRGVDLLQKLSEQEVYAPSATPTSRLAMHLHLL